MESMLHKIGYWLWRAIVVFVAVAVAIVIVAVVLNRQTSVEFDRVAAMKYDDAMAEIHKRSKSYVYVIFDDKRAAAICTGLEPGDGVGMGPRFVNVGTGRAAVYRGPGNEWFVLGRVQVLDYVNGRWKVNCVVENERFEHRRLTR